MQHVRFVKARCSGPGLLANEMAALVGRNGRVCGIDISEDMLRMSRRRCTDQPWTEFKKADATNLPFPDHSFDAAVSTQVYQYVANISPRSSPPGQVAYVREAAADDRAGRQ